jgi:hypothetical protein
MSLSITQLELKGLNFKVDNHHDITVTSEDRMKGQYQMNQNILRVHTTQSCHCDTRRLGTVAPTRIVHVTVRTTYDVLYVTVPLITKSYCTPLQLLLLQ